MTLKREKLIAELNKSVEKNILLSQTNKDYLNENVSRLPIKILEKLLKDLNSQNALVDKYIKIAIDNDPKIVKDMQSTVKRIKKKIVGLQESEEKGDLEQTLEEELNNL